jgi:hypothetical protein
VELVGRHGGRGLGIRTSGEAGRGNTDGGGKRSYTWLKGDGRRLGVCCSGL